MWKDAGAARRVEGVLGDSIVASVPPRTPPLESLPRQNGILVAPKAHLHPGVSSPPQSPIPEVSEGVRTAYALESDR